MSTNIDLNNLLKCLNNNQLDIVTSSLNNILVLAGAGSGKTHAITYRIAWLLSHNILPSSIMTVTFSNKAAMEMNMRINKLLNDNTHNMLMGTFHSLAYHFVRHHYLNLNLSKNFQILDSIDQYNLVKKVIKNHNFIKNNNELSINKIILYINEKKNEGLRPDRITNYDNGKEFIYLKIYKMYQEICNNYDLIDFGELLLLVYELCINKKEIMNYYHNVISNIIIDEFQDTNSIQYNWIKMLVGNNTNIMVVGDDDQSIYSWRGAKKNNMHIFLQDYPDSKIVYLEQNYRSTNNILKCANTLIANNKIRFKKTLWTRYNNGDYITIYGALNEFDEANYVIKFLKIWRNMYGNLKNCAILYRNNFQANIFEELLIKSSIPYHIYGMKSFYEKNEIKNVIAYLRLILNHNDNLSFERIINLPRRGIGKKTLNMIRDVSFVQKISFWQSCEYLLYKKFFNNRLSNIISEFLHLINILFIKIKELPLYMQVKIVAHESGLLSMYECSNDTKKKQCFDNIYEFLAMIYRIQFTIKDTKLDALKLFLSQIAMLSYDNEENKSCDSVSLMTVHASKGMEFFLVFLVGLEEGLFPHTMSIKNSELLEEERRLLYVGLTRAMKKIVITYAKTRMRYGIKEYRYPSRFIYELPLECIKHIINK
uniref:DNA 3'-5' helicase n=1 Tax=Candidatus Aschnera chinzeii TaxID=1485666 RepID=A0AAT9G5C0_9ENTR|nr:MAG: DNA helicase II [Candidatus Aschnera chinzeii]